jgi:putative heme-binding domain-containing protein
VLEITFARHGMPSPAQRDIIIQHLSQYFPAPSFAVNRELSQLLAFLQWPGVIDPALSLMEDARTRWIASGKNLPDALAIGPQEESIWFARVLCEVPAAQFTPGQRERYFTWFVHALEFKGGNNFVKFIEAIRNRALDKLDVSERTRITAVMTAKQLQLATTAPAAGTTPAPARSFLRTWTLGDIEPHLGASNAPRNFARGREIYSSMFCAKCHRCGPEGAGGVGPDLTAIGARFSRRDIVDAIISPSKVIPDQYASYLFTRRDGSTVWGQIAAETADAIEVYSDPFGQTKAALKKSEIVSRETAKVSLMPAGLLDNLALDEILDLLAFLEAGGDPNATRSKPAKAGP